MRHLTLLALVPSLALAQLPPSTTWKYSVISGGGSSTRLLVFLDGEDAPTRKARASWTLESGPLAADGSVLLTRTVRDTEGRETVTFKVWPGERGLMALRDGAAPELARPLVTRDAPPRVLSVERVRCAVSVLEGVDATCAGRAGGPLQQPELPLVVQVRRDTSGGTRALAAFGAFVLTGGVLMPRVDDRSIVAELQLARPSLPPLLARWRKGPHTAAALSKLGLAEEVDAETLGALLVLGGATDLDVVHASTLRAPALDRWPLIRLAREFGANVRLTVQLVARLVAAHALSAPVDEEQRALQASALVGLEPRLTGAVDALLAGAMPTLLDVAANSKKPDVDAARALETAALAPGEGFALTTLMSRAAVGQRLPRFIERLPDDEGLEVINALVAEAPDAQRVALLQKLPAWVDRVLRGEHGVALVKSLSFDDRRAKLLNAAWKRAPVEARPALLKHGVAGFSFNDARLQFLKTWLPQTRLSLADSREVLDAFTSDSERNEAARLLVSSLPEGAERDALVMQWMQHTSDDTLRVRTLQELKPHVTVDAARALYDALHFDSERTGTALALLPLVPEAERAEFFVYCVTHLSFDDGRLQLLRAPNRPTLTDAQRERVRKAISFEQQQADALLK